MRNLSKSLKAKSHKGEFADKIVHSDRGDGNNIDGHLKKTYVRKLEI